MAWVTFFVATGFLMKSIYILPGRYIYTVKHIDLAEASSQGGC